MLAVDWWTFGLTAVGIVVAVGAVFLGRWLQDRADQKQRARAEQAEAEQRAMAAATVVLPHVEEARRRMAVLHESLTTLVVPMPERIGDRALKDVDVLKAAHEATAALRRAVEVRSLAPAVRVEQLEEAQATAAIFEAMVHVATLDASPHTTADVAAAAGQAAARYAALADALRADLGLTAPTPETAPPQRA